MDPILNINKIHDKFTYDCSLFLFHIQLGCFNALFASKEYEAIAQVLFTPSYSTKTEALAIVICVRIGCCVQVFRERSLRFMTHEAQCIYFDYFSFDQSGGTLDRKFKFWGACNHTVKLTSTLHPLNILSDQ